MNSVAIPFSLDFAWLTLEESPLLFFLRKEKVLFCGVTHQFFLLVFDTKFSSQKSVVEFSIFPFFWVQGRHNMFYRCWGCCVKLKYFLQKWRMLRMFPFFNSSKKERRPLTSQSKQLKMLFFLSRDFFGFYNTMFLHTMTCHCWPSAYF